MNFIEGVNQTGLTLFIFQKNLDPHISVTV